MTTPSETRNQDAALFSAFTRMLHSYENFSPQPRKQSAFQNQHSMPPKHHSEDKNQHPSRYSFASSYSAAMRICTYSRAVTLSYFFGLFLLQQPGSASIIVSRLAVAKNGIE